MTFNGYRGRWLKMKNPACEAVPREEDEYKGREPAFAVQYFFLLKLFLAFLIFLATERRFRRLS
jgi:hypothetical protein